jgi:cytochrome P450
MRRQLAHAFSAKALKEQTDVVLQYADLWIQQLAKVGQQDVDIVPWYNWLTFDIIGDLAFGEPFGAIEEGE